MLALGYHNVVAHGDDARFGGAEHVLPEVNLIRPLMLHETRGAKWGT